MNAWIFFLVLIAILGGIIAAVECGDSRKSKRQQKILNCSTSTVGRVRIVERVLQTSSWYPMYDLLAEFVWDGRSWYAEARFMRKPPWNEGDEVTIYFDPRNPDENTILFNERRPG